MPTKKTSPQQDGDENEKIKNQKSSLQDDTTEDDANTSETALVKKPVGVDDHPRPEPPRKPNFPDTGSK